MYDLSWSASDKKIARSAYEDALESVLAKLLTEFKAKAAAATTPSDMWAVEDYLRQQRRKLDEVFDDRYSRLPLVLARLIREGHLDLARLRGLSEEKLEKSVGFCRHESCWCEPNRAGALDLQIITYGCM